jgi:hypothetical protein
MKTQRGWSRPTALALTIALVASLVPMPAHASIIGSAKVILNIQDVRTVGVESATVVIQRDFGWDITHGTGDGQAQLCYQGVRSLATGANEDLDVAGSLTNLYGAAVFTKLKLVVFYAAKTNTTNITVSRPAANGVPLFAAVSDALAPLKPGGFFAFADPSTAGVAVTAATADLINVANSAGATGTYTVVLCGLP